MRLVRIENSWLKAPRIGKRRNPLVELSVANLARRKQLLVRPFVRGVSMHKRRYATADTPDGPGSDTRHGPRRLHPLRLLIVCAAMLVASCQQTGILDPQGPVASAQRVLLINSTEIMLVVVVPVILSRQSRNQQVCCKL